MPTVRVGREDFLSRLGLVSPGLSNKPFITQSGCFVFAGGWVTTFNDEICCRSRSGLPEDYEAAVPARELLAFVGAADDEELALDLGRDEVRVTGTNKRAGIRADAEIVLPFDSVAPPAKWRDLPDGFADAVKQTAAAAGSNNEEFITVCVHVHPDYTEATDRRQSVRYDIGTGVAAPYLVRATSLAHVGSRDDGRGGFTRCGETDDWVHFRNKTLVFSCRRHIEDYPTDALTRAFGFRGAPLVLPRGAEAAAEVGAEFLRDDRENDKVAVVLKDGGMTVRGTGPKGWVECRFDASYRGDPVSFRIAPETLIKLVTDYTECEIGSGKLMVRGERWKYLTVLGKPDDDVEDVPAAGDEEPGDAADDEA